MLKVKKQPRNVFGVIKYPILTTKTRGLILKNKYSFAVDTQANKKEIKEALEQLFKMEINSINTSLLPLRHRRIGKFIGPLARYKKVIVKVPRNSGISFLQE